ncbi:MAG: zinc ribbon domain-containing protein [Candidatus Aminicenantes bacterium]
MAIKKCPYCKAFIEEDSEFCSNCGTKLIFPEDEDIEEEIPGERVVEEEEEEVHKSSRHDQQAAPPEDMDDPDLKEEESPESEESAAALKEDLPEEPEPAEPEEEEPEPGGDVSSTPPSSDTPFETTSFESPPPSEEDDKDEGDSRAAPPSSGSVDWLFPEEDMEGEEEDLKTRDLEDMVDPADKEKEEIEQFLDSLKKERRKIKKDTKAAEEDLPPWAEKMRDADKEPDDQEQETKVKTTEEAVRLEPEEEREIPEEEEEEDTGAFEEFDRETSEIDIDDTPALTGHDQGMLFGTEQEESRSKGFGMLSFLKPSRWLKSRLFDVVLIAGLWLVSLGIAAYLTGNPVFSLIAKALLPAAGFFVILTVIYFSLFLVFLRETLGDFIFPKEE